VLPVAVELRQFTDVFNFASDKRYFGTREHRDGGDSSSMPMIKKKKKKCGALLFGVRYEQCGGSGNVGVVGASK